MCAVGSQTQYHIARADAAAGNDILFFHYADGKTRQIVFSDGIHTRHFGSFPANQGAAGFFATLCNAFDDIGCARNIQFAAGEIIQEKQRFCSLNQNIVDTHCNKVDAHRIVFIPIKGKFELGTHAVRTADQYGIFIFLADFDQCAKTAQIPQYFRTHGAFGKRFDVFDQLVACVDIDTCIAVTQ
ncbi:Uncharacterised protein [Neisseria meningitidis]|nr:hypothetical protein NM2000080_2154 [Neisseria meningitidis 2000080]EOB45510.1 hypothetical protein NM94018_2143 [Neisseria meningitidis 94018]CWN58383.1 Uncharacterised protein [Neisseria meningitidis]CWO35045.1 Uncharacterised protein [Neisseria meningitidis]CWO38607.1 Uncharacterised protein [Neisseria meningitidis]